jgi:DNA-directed RNA polymerase specialized sigma subunit
MNNYLNLNDVYDSPFFRADPKLLENIVEIPQFDFSILNVNEKQVVKYYYEDEMTLIQITKITNHSIYKLRKIISSIKKKLSQQIK